METASTIWKQPEQYLNGNLLLAWVSAGVTSDKSILPESIKIHNKFKQQGMELRVAQDMSRYI